MEARPIVTLSRSQRIIFRPLFGTTGLRFEGVPTIASSCRSGNMIYSQNPGLCIIPVAVGLKVEVNVVSSKRQGLVALS